MSIHNSFKTTHAKLDIHAKGGASGTAVPGSRIQGAAKYTIK
jgi:hypothetical protein